MDDFIFEDFIYNEDEDDDFSYLRFSEQELMNSPFETFKTEEGKETAESDSPLTEESPDKTAEFTEQTIYEHQPRQKMKIEVNGSQKQKYINAKTGKKNETSGLSANYKTLLNKIFEERLTKNRHPLKEQ